MEARKLLGFIEAVYIMDGLLYVDLSSNRKLSIMLEELAVRLSANGRNSFFSTLKATVFHITDNGIHIIAKLPADFDQYKKLEILIISLFEKNGEAKTTSINRSISEITKSGI